MVVSPEPVEEDHTTQGIPSVATILADLRAAGIPATTAWCTLESANHWLVVTMPADWPDRMGIPKSQLIDRIRHTIFENNKFGLNIPKVQQRRRLRPGLRTLKEFAGQFTHNLGRLGPPEP